MHILYLTHLDRVSMVRLCQWFFVVYNFVAFLVQVGPTYPSVDPPKNFKDIVRELNNRPAFLNPVDGHFRNIPTKHTDFQEFAYN